MFTDSNKIKEPNMTGWSEWRKENHKKTQMLLKKRIQLRLEKKIKQLKQNNNDTDNYPSEQKRVIRSNNLL